MGGAQWLALPAEALGTASLVALASPLGLVLALSVILVWRALKPLDDLSLLVQQAAAPEQTASADSRSTTPRGQP